MPAGMELSAARIRPSAGPPALWLDISPAPHYSAVPHRPTLDRFGLLATKPGTKGGPFSEGHGARVDAQSERGCQ